MWRYISDNKIAKKLEKLGHVTSNRILDYIDKMRESGCDPTSDGKPLKGNKRWRYRVGDYRIICDIDHETKTVTLVDVGHRSSIYESVTECSDLVAKILE